MPSSTLPFLGLGSERAIHEIGDALPDALFTTDVDGRVTWWNRSAERITGWTREEALGRDCSILAGDSVGGCSCGKGPIRCGMTERERDSKTCTVRAKDGRLLLIVKSAVPLHAPDGRPVGALETFAEVGDAAGVPPSELSPALVATAEQGLLGESHAMVELRRMIGLVARSDSTVMILGESGTGKERVAEAIHAASARSGGPFVRVNCSALNENLVESELFGHVKGAFTGALRDRRGRFQEADGGTLLLDEIGDVSPAVQVKLLRAIEQRQIERVGESAPLGVDVRLLCATHRNLKALVEVERFRADLYFRLAVFPLHVPPLRSHPEDVAVIGERFLARRAPTRTGRPRRITSAALEVLVACRWPGNVRELQNVLEFSALQAGEDDVDLAHLPAEIRQRCTAAAPTPRSAGAMPTDEALRRAVAAFGGNRTAAARSLGISRVTLWKRLKAGEPAS